MEQNRALILEQTLEQYSRWYNIDRKPEEELPLVAAAQFHEHAEGFVLVKKAQTWTADSHEYTFFFSVPRLTKAIYDECLAKTLELGMPLVEPKSGHRSTYIVMVVICDAADDDALRELKKCRISKSFQFSLKGWMEVHTAAVEVGKAEITANRAAYNTAKFLENVLRPQKRKRNKVKEFLLGRK